MSSSQDGGDAAMREALKQIYDYAWAHGVWEIEAMAKAALAEPARNCDVGTAEEQAERFKQFCNDHQEPWHGCANYCPVLMSEKCALAWAQMPYEVKESKVKE